MVVTTLISADRARQIGIESEARRKLANEHLSETTLGQPEEGFEQLYETVLEQLARNVEEEAPFESQVHMYIPAEIESFARFEIRKRLIADAEALGYKCNLYPANEWIITVSWA